MIGLIASARDYSYRDTRERAKHPLDHNHMFVSLVILSGIILGPRVDQLARETLTSGFICDDAIMSPLLGSEKPSPVRIIIGHTYYTLSSGTTHS
jgi:hypothetical protein